MSSSKLSRTAVYGTKDAKNKGVLPDQNFLKGGQAADSRAMYQNALADLRTQQQPEAADRTLGSKLKGLRSNALSRLFVGQDSKEYVAVQNALSAVLDSMSMTFTDDKKTNEYILRNTSKKYSELIEAGNVYLKKKGGHSPIGARRKTKVSQILELAQMDLEQVQHLIYDAQVMDPRELEGLTWERILYGARESSIEVESLEDYGTFGAGVKNANGFGAGRILDEGMFTHADSEVMKKGEATFLGTNAFSNKTSEERDGENFVDWGFEDNEKVNISKRNVAMSRVANLLGIGGVIAQSKSVKVHEKSTKKTYHGNLMERAFGQAAINAERKERAEAQKENNFNKREDNIFKKVSSTVQKELSSLQVLDYICGQADRHGENYFLEFDENSGQYTHIKGIDNDMSFSTGVDLEEEWIKRGQTVGRMKVVVDSNDNLIIPHMDSKLADNIVGVSDSDFVFAIKDLIEPRMVAFALKRFQKVKRAVVKEKSKENSKVFLNESEWGRVSHDDFMKETYLFKESVNKLRADKKEGTDKGYFNVGKATVKGREDYERHKGESYYSRIMLSMMGIGYNGDVF
ncbi:MAG: hypothetical protein IJ390_09470 [Lachnospiraceae bacterium]|nr:hypothetical protein [Lachnospiraceae bacterium]